MIFHGTLVYLQLLFHLLIFNFDLPKILLVGSNVNRKLFALTIIFLISSSNFHPRQSINTCYKSQLIISIFLLKENTWYRVKERNDLLVGDLLSFSLSTKELKISEHFNPFILIILRLNFLIMVYIS